MLEFSICLKLFIAIIILSTFNIADLKHILHEVSIKCSSLSFSNIVNFYLLPNFC